MQTLALSHDGDPAKRRTCRKNPRHGRAGRANVRRFRTAVKKPRVAAVSLFPSRRLLCLLNKRSGSIRCAKWILHCSYRQAASVEVNMGKAKKSRAVRVKFAQTKRLLSPKDCRLKGNMEKEEVKRKKVRDDGFET